jgi:hypothetical protein
MHVVGTVVDDTETAKLGDRLIGQPPSAADVELGQRIDVLQDTSSARQWITYPVKLDVLKTHRYVVEIAGDRIVAVEMVAREGSKLDLPMKLVYEEKAKGKTPRECEAALGMGAPLITVRSTATGELGQLYDASMIEGLTSKRYCVLRFDAAGRCKSLDFAEVKASAR